MNDRQEMAGQSGRRRGPGIMARLGKALGPGPWDARSNGERVIQFPGMHICT